MGQGPSGAADDGTMGWPAAGEQQGERGEVRAATMQPCSTSSVVSGAVSVTSPIARMLPVPPDANATGQYLARLIAQAEEQGPLSHHDLELLRLQLNAIRQEVSRRARDQPNNTQHPPPSVHPPHSHAPASSYAVSSPSPVMPPKRLKQEALPTIPPSTSSGSSVVSSGDEPEDPIALIGQHQAQIHAANMEMIRQAQMHYQLYQQPGSSQPWHSVPQPQPSHLPPAPSSHPLPAPSSHSLPVLSHLPQAPIAPADWQREARTHAGEFSSSASHVPQHTEPFGLGEELSPPWYPFSPPEEPELGPLGESATTDCPPSSNQPRAEQRRPSIQSYVDAAERLPAPATQLHETTSKAANVLQYYPGPKQPIGSLPAGYERPTPAARSATFLANYRNRGVLESLEREYNAGNFSAAGVRQCLMTCRAMLEPDDQDELMNSFSKMNLKGCEHVLATCPHIDIQPTPGVPCCLERAGVGSSSDLFRKAQTELEHRLIDTPVPQGVSFAEAMAAIMAGDRELAESISTALAQDISPSEPAPDDDDGVARMRFNIIFSMPAESVKNKRKKSSAASESVSAPAAAQPQLRVYRCVQVNKALEKLSGMTQASLCRNIVVLSKPGGAFESLRADHIRSTHIINTMWRLNHVTESHMYQVRRRLDGIEVYCLVHVKHRIDHGVILSVEHAIIPLPVDDAHPIPPFVEGVDLDVDTLLYGYKPPQPHAQAEQQ